MDLTWNEPTTEVLFMVVLLLWGLFGHAVQIAAVFIECVWGNRAREVVDIPKNLKYFKCYSKQLSPFLNSKQAEQQTSH